MMSEPTTFEYSRWRHGGWYVHNVRYLSGACGCVSRNYPDRKWRIACDDLPFEEQPTFKCRDDAARAEWHKVQVITLQSLCKQAAEWLSEYRERVMKGEITGRLMEHDCELTNWLKSASGR